MEERKFESYLKIHLRDKAGLSDREKIPALKKKRMSKKIQLVLNILFILFLAYAHVKNLTDFSATLYYILYGVFAVNVLLLLIQARQIRDLIDYLKTRAGR